MAGQPVRDIFGYDSDGDEEPLTDEEWIDEGENEKEAEAGGDETQTSEASDNPLKRKASDATVEVKKGRKKHRYVPIAWQSPY